MWFSVGVDSNQLTPTHMSNPAISRPVSSWTILLRTSWISTCSLSSLWQCTSHPTHRTLGQFYSHYTITLLRHLNAQFHKLPVRRLFARVLRISNTSILMKDKRVGLPAGHHARFCFTRTFFALMLFIRAKRVSNCYMQEFFFWPFVRMFG